MKKIKGDLLKFALEGKFDVIIHQCNCYHNFGAGIALQILKKFPLAFEADKRTEYGNRAKLGTISYCTIPLGRGFIIVNGYSQFGCGTDRVRTEYDAVRKVFQKVKQEFTGMKIGIPKYGCGLAGGNIEIVTKIIEEEMIGENITMVLYP